MYRVDLSRLSAKRQQDKGWITLYMPVFGALRPGGIIGKAHTISTSTRNGLPCDRTYRSVSASLMYRGGYDMCAAFLHSDVTDRIYDAFMQV